MDPISPIFAFGVPNHLLALLNLTSKVEAFHPVVQRRVIIPVYFVSDIGIPTKISCLAHVINVCNVGAYIARLELK
jgi:hypothetical protein